MRCSTVFTRYEDAGYSRSGPTALITEGDDRAGSATVRGQRLRWLHVGAIDGSAGWSRRLALLASVGAGSGSSVLAASPTGWRPPLDRGGRRAGPGGPDAQGLSEARVVRGRLSQCRPGSGTSRPRIPTKIPAGYAAAFRHRYGLHPAPFPNDGLPMGLRRGIGPGGVKTGLQIDCMLCHGGSIGGQSYVGLGNTQLDLKAVLFELTIADGRRPPFSTFVLNSSRGTNNAGQIAAVLLSLRNPDLSVRSFPLPLAVNLPEMDTPPWWHLKRKRTMYYDGRTDARSVRTNMQFLLGEKSLDELKALEPAFRDVQAFLQEPRAAEVPVPDRHRHRPAAGAVVFKSTCVRCHGTYGPDGTYPNKIVPLDMIGTDPARSLGPLRPPGRPLQHDLAGGREPGRHQTRRLPGPAARRHLGHRPLPAQRLGADLARPARVVEPPGAVHSPPLDRLRPLRHRPTSAGSSPRSAPTNWHRRPGGRRFRPSSSSTPPASAWATAATPSATSSPRKSGWT